ncbi:MAG: aminodeoxychorismate/anthranilate synthase component II [Heliobacteriaceae bacterium]|nr:aminodeoxychorismate/anthranilate synthase component II [Heliobacteriaceae bacterium]MDD4587369.1 aminodeoxychorismate/anthranilate synthase component II [Heliobacteriaceae bacterium]
MILMIDNYDSFTYNLVQYFAELGETLRVVRNDSLPVSELAALAPDYLVLSPGPGTPDRAGVCLDLIRHFAGKIPVLGVCLGHQAIGQGFGGRVVRASRLMHGKTSLIYHDKKTIFRGLPNPFTATRYHSLLLAETALPPCLEVSARTALGEVMAVRHKEFPVEGVQFHPESVLTPAGKKLLKNFLALEVS